MGKRGPARTPAPLKELRGDPGKRGIQAEVQPQPALASDMECPEKLQGEARAEWYRLIAGLKKSKLFTAVDRAALIAYCDLYAMYLNACDKIGDEPVQKSKRGAGRLSPYFKVKIETSKAMLVYLRQFGFSPASRLQVADGDENEDEFSKWKKGAKK